MARLQARTPSFPTMSTDLLGSAAQGVVPVNPTGWFRSPAFDQGQLRTGSRLLTVAAQGPLDESGQLMHDADPAAQLALALANVARVLTDAGMAWADVAQLRIHTTDLDALLEVYDTLVDHLGTAGARPPTTLVEVSRLPVAGMTVCIDGLALR
jgi:enamine deaminase RidA (YjgF/YER057c/UK114 family)